MYIYLWLNIISFFLVFFISFEKKITYYKKWPGIFLASIFSALFFLIWDYIFVKWQVWGFNPAYLTGLYISKLPVEEIAFFITVPFASIFVYEVVVFSVKETKSRQIRGRQITKFLCVLLLGISVLNTSKIYTLTVSVLLLVFLLIILKIQSKLLSRFYIAYAYTLIPFLIFNGILTNGIKLVDPGPVVWYNNAENLGLRLIGIPIEDFFYLMLLLLVNLSCYNYLQNRKMKLL